MGQALEAPKGLPKFRRRQVDGRAALPSNLQLEEDAYSELYPDRFGGLAEELDSDEEGKAAKDEEQQEGADKKKLQVRCWVEMGVVQNGPLFFPSVWCIHYHSVDIST